MPSYWIAVDLDGTLAHADLWQGLNHIGKPYMPMVRRVREWLKQGWEVRIFTSRAICPHAIPPVKEWLEKLGLGDLQITAQKDMYCIAIFDDRAFPVREGKRLCRRRFIPLPW